MTRRGGPLGLAILCVLLVGAPVLAQEGPCPDDEHAKIVTLPGKPTTYQTPQFNEPNLSRQVWIRQRDDNKTENFDLGSRDELVRLQTYIVVLQRDTKPITKAQQRALAEALRLVTRAIALHDSGQASSPEMGPVLTHLNIAAEAYGYEFIEPIPLQTPVTKAAELLWAPKVASGTDQAGNPDLKASPFWIKPDNIGAKDLYRPVKGNPIDLGKVVCDFDEAKTGYGTKGGFDIKCKSVGKFKLKFGPETRSEPFNARIYNALGFNVPTVEYTPRVTLSYDRHIFSQFNCRTRIKAYVSAMGINLKKFKVGEPYLNPFRFIRSAKLKNGDVIPMKELYRKMFGFYPPLWTDHTINDEKQDRPELDDKRYVATEAEIDTVTTFEGSLEVKDEAADSIGSWNWNSSVYQDLREVRGAAVLSMWLGNYDVRWDNNKVKLVDDGKGNQRLVMYISDIGAGLGNPRSILVRSNDEPNKFPWAFTASNADYAAHASGPNWILSRITKPDGFAIVDFLPDFENETMQAITRKDMKWMAEMIGQLTDDQIKAALIAANFQSAEVYLLTQKLLNRREHLLRDSGGVGTVVRREELYNSHDPRHELPMSAILPDKRVVVAKKENEKLGREKPVKLLVRNAQVEEYKD
jgi:hypothetical protein